MACHEGQIVWARIGKFPFWPAIVCPDPDGQLRQETAWRKTTLVKWNVRFLADRGRRSWVANANVVPFLGADDMDRMRRQLPANIRSTDARVRPFTVSATLRKGYESAIREAQVMAKLSLKQRLPAFERTVPAYVRPTGTSIAPSTPSISRPAASPLNSPASVAAPVTPPPQPQPAPLPLGRGRLRKAAAPKPPPYKRCRVNRPVAPVRLSKFNADDAPLCACRSHKNQQPCGSFTCFNRATQVECVAGRCRMGESCLNQRFQRRRNGAALVPAQRPATGWGLMTGAETRIAEGEFVIELVGELVNRATHEERMRKRSESPASHSYVLELNRDRYIDAEVWGNPARFMNHSCEPNCEAQVWQVLGQERVGMFALQDIEPNTELTFNYNCKDAADNQKICHCGARRCAGFIGAKYVEPLVDPRSLSANTRKTSAKPGPSRATTLKRRRATEPEPEIDGNDGDDDDADHMTPRRKRARKVQEM